MKGSVVFTVSPCFPPKNKVTRYRERQAARFMFSQRAPTGRAEAGALKSVVNLSGQVLAGAPPELLDSAQGAREMFPKCLQPGAGAAPDRGQKGKILSISQNRISS